MTRTQNFSRSFVPGPRGLLVAAALAASAGMALAMQPAPGSEPPLLSGPKVERTQNPDSLVRRGFDGEMERLPELPEIAAVRLLELDEEARARVDALLSDRAAKVDAIVKAHLPAVQQLTEARRAGDRASMREPMREIREALRPLAEEGMLVEVVAAGLPDTERARYRDLVVEYHRAALRARQQGNGMEPGPGRRGGGERPGGPRADGPRAGGAGGAGGAGMNGPLDDLGMEGPGDGAEKPERPQRRRAGAGEGAQDGTGEGQRDRRGREVEGRAGQRAVAMQSMLVEVQQSYMRIVGDLKAQKDEFDGVLDRLDLTPEQRGKVEAILAEARSKREVGAPPDRAQRREMLRAIAQELSPEQRRALREALGGQRGNAEPGQRGQRGQRGPRGQQPSQP